MLRKENAPVPGANGNRGAVCLLAGDDSQYSTRPASRKPILTARVAQHEQLLRGIPSDLADMDIARSAARKAWSWRNEWSVANAATRETGRLLTKAEADAKLRSLLRQQVRP